MHYIIYKRLLVGQGSEIDVATCYRLEIPGMESRWGRDFPHPFKPKPGTHSAGAWRHPPTPSISEAKERVEIYFYILLPCLLCLF